MNLAEITARLDSNLGVFQGLLRNVSDEQAGWKPDLAKWSLLEVINHLVDEEVDDFRTRLRLLLEDPTQEWPPIDPPRWAMERRYNERNLSESVDRFEKARQQSVNWLKSLPAIDLNVEHVHPALGTMKAGDLLYSWLTHDLIHIRQMNRLHYEFLMARKERYSVSYAGNW